MVGRGRPPYGRSSHSGTESSNPAPSSVESVANSKRHVVTVTTGLLVGAQVH